MCGLRWGWGNGQRFPDLEGWPGFASSSPTILEVLFLFLAVVCFVFWVWGFGFRDVGFRFSVCSWSVRSFRL